MLPYEFDTTGVDKTILRGFLGLLAVVVVPGILYSLFVSHSTTAVVQLLLIGAVVTIFGWVFLKKLEGSRGIVTPDAVVTQRGRLYGPRLSRPAVTFPLPQFKTVRVERILVSRRTHERVYLLGKPGTPDILVARTTHNDGIVIGHELAAALNLPYAEEVVPF
jgi:hypothetical protein